MGLFSGGASARPPPPPPPPANPPTYASSIFAPPSTNPGSVFGGMGGSVMTSPFGAPDQRATQRKSLFGQ